MGPGATLEDACEAVRQGAPLLIVEGASGAYRGVIDPLEVRVRWVRGDEPSGGLAELVHAQVPVPRGGEAALPTEALAGLGAVLDARPVEAAASGERVELVRVATRPLGALDAVLMAGGKGQRLRPLTASTPKPLLEVQGVPIVEHLVRHLRSHGVDRVFVSVLYLADQVRAFFGDGSRLGVAVDFLEESQPLGTAGALGLARGRARGAVIVANGDILTNVDVGAMLAHHLTSRAAVTVGTVPYGWRIPYGVVHSDHLRLTRVEEKPLVRFETNAGLYVFDAAALASLRPGEAYDMVELLNRWAAEGSIVTRFPIVEAWSDVGLPGDFERVQNDPAYAPPQG